MNLSTAAKVTRVMNGVAAGTTDQNSTSVDMKGFDAVQFVALFGTIDATAVTSVKAQGSSDNSTWSDLASTAVSVADDDDNQAVILDLNKPSQRYVRCVVDRGTANAVIDGVIALQYHATHEPVTHDSSTVAASETHLSPIAGTA